MIPSGKLETDGDNNDLVRKIIRRLKNMKVIILLLF